MLLLLFNATIEVINLRVIAARRTLKMIKKKSKARVVRSTLISFLCV